VERIHAAGVYEIDAAGGSTHRGLKLITSPLRLVKKPRACQGYAAKGVINMQTIHETKPQTKATPVDCGAIHGGVLTLKGTKPRVDAPPVRPTATPRIHVLDEFWFVWCPTEQRPKRQHASLENALTEARRLRQLAPEKEFLIYKAVAIK
jgi:hypothetical protein